MDLSNLRVGKNGLFLQRRVVRDILFILGFAAVALATATPADAWYRHRSYRSGRGYNRYSSQAAAVQRATMALNAAHARVFAARANLQRQTRQARSLAESSAGVSAARSQHTQAKRDYQSARQALVDRLKKDNPEFRDLQQQNEAMRAQVVSLVKSGDDPAAVERLESQMRSNARHITQIEDAAISADGHLKDLVVDQASASQNETSATNQAMTAASQNPAVLAARKQLQQAEQQELQAASRYNSTLASASIPRRGYSHRHYRRGYGGFRVASYQYAPRFSHPRVGHPHVRLVHVRQSARGHHR